MSYSFRWGIETFDTPFTQIPNPLLKYYHLVPWKVIKDGEIIKEGVGISNTEMMLIIHLASFKFEYEEGKAAPAITSTIRERMNYGSNQGIINIVKGLEEKGLLIISRSKGQRSEYNFEPLSNQVWTIYLQKELSGKSNQSRKVDDHSSRKVDSNNSKKKKKQTNGGNDSKDYLASILQAKESMNPEASEPSELDKYFGRYRQDVLNIYQEIFGNHPNPDRKQALIDLSQESFFDPETFKPFLSAYNRTGRNPYDLTKISEEYRFYTDHGQLPEKYPAYQKNGGPNIETESNGDTILRF